MTLLDYSYTALKKHARRTFIKRYLERERCKGQIIDATAMKPGDWWNGRRVSLCPKCGRPGFVERKYENADHRLLIVNGFVSRSEDDCRWGRWESTHAEPGMVGVMIGGEEGKE